VQNVSTVCDMELLCDNSHLHEPWDATPKVRRQRRKRPILGRSAVNSSTNSSPSQQQGVQCPTPSSANMLHTWIAAFVSKPMCNPPPPDCHGSVNLATSCRFLHRIHCQRIFVSSALPQWGHPECGIKAIGVYRSPRICRGSLAARHLGVASDEMPGPMLDAVQFCASHSVSQVAQHRSEGLRRMIFRLSNYSPMKKP
jgi:hypothetical protein